MNKKIMISLTGALILSAAGNIYLAASQNKDDPKIDEVILQTECRQPSEASIKENPEETPDVYVEAAVRYIKTVKTGTSSDLYIDRLASIKDILSKSLYSRLTPQMTDEEIEMEREANKKLESSSIVTSRITDTSYSYVYKNVKQYEVYVIYTVMTEQNRITDHQRYLCRMDVTLEDGKPVITNIYEDSVLADGRYNK